MKLRPRHYVLLALLFLLAGYNVFRFHRMHQAREAAMQHGSSPLWTYFDRAAALRDAPEARFEPALIALSQRVDGGTSLPMATHTSADELTQLQGCRTWLLFYRQAHSGGGAQNDWLPRASRHVATCMANHRDIAQ